MDDVTEIQKKAIMNLKEKCKMYFKKCYKWAVFNNKKLNDPWLSLVKNVLKKCGFSVSRQYINDENDTKYNGLHITKNKNILKQASEKNQHNEFLNKYIIHN